ncbi:monooxygenase [Salmonella enterica subsp. enterica]|uniref:Monooxygenase n=1 Tax=Salmonella enterica I TaxID=59201 RepID=A0A379VRR9_SALET|nr:monooxygenase [Salmonella enterica subsp. enterica]
MRGEVCVFITLASRTSSSIPWGTSGSPIIWPRGQCVLIRPDGYVGAFFHGKQSNDIENYLSRFAIGIKDEY